MSITENEDNQDDEQSNQDGLDDVAVVDSEHHSEDQATQHGAQNLRENPKPEGNEGSHPFDPERYIYAEAEQEDEIEHAAERNEDVVRIEGAENVAGKFTTCQ